MVPNSLNCGRVAVLRYVLCCNISIHLDHSDRCKNPYLKLGSLEKHLSEPPDLNELTFSPGNSPEIFRDLRGSDIKTLDWKDRKKLTCAFVCLAFLWYLIIFVH